MEEYIEFVVKNRLDNIRCYEPSHDGNFKDFPKLRFFDPMGDQQLKILCPVHNLELQNSGQWCDFTNKEFKPRLVFDCGRNLLLISKLYRCKHCQKPYRAHSEEIFCQIKDQIPNEFLFLWKTVITSDLYDNIVNSSIRGKAFKHI